ncbi:hypothetical protein K1719_029064 [Acacia pycnantha]|nr:hypothetical protein K1719_029064 [Acacia pycnantha]
MEAVFRSSGYMLTCLVVPKSITAYPQVLHDCITVATSEVNWKHGKTRLSSHHYCKQIDFTKSGKAKDQGDGNMVRMMVSLFNLNHLNLEKWFIPSSNEMGQILCKDPEVLDSGAHEILPRLSKEKLHSS